MPSERAGSLERPRARTVDLLFLVLLVLDGADEQRSGVRENHPTRLEVLIPRQKDGVQHGLVQQEIPHPLRDDDIELLDREFSLFKLPFDEGDDCNENT